MESIRIEIQGSVRQVKPETSILEILGKEYVRQYRIVGATLNHRLVGLNTPVGGEAEIRPVMAHEKDGQGILHRSAAHMLHSIMHARYPQLRLIIGQSLFGGYYYEVHRTQKEERRTDLLALARDLTSALRDLIEQDVPFVQKQVPAEAAEAFLKSSRGERAEAIQFWATSRITVAELNGFADIQHGPYPPSTGYLANLRVDAYPPGLILQFDAEKPPPRPDEGRMLYECYRETRDWNRRVGVATVSDLNRAILNDRVADVVRVAEALHEKKIAEIADAVSAHRNNVRMVCVSGPSSSGKTTFAKRLLVQLRVNGIEPVSLSLDDYYRDRSETPRDEKGRLDFEALEALDLDLLEENLDGLLTGKRVLVPQFDFAQGLRKEKESWNPLQLEDGQMLLIEGIHAVHPRLHEMVGRKNTFGVFISALTQLAIDEHNRIFTSDMRLMRRIVRDRRYRGTGASDTIARWDSVRRGEERHIFPYQEDVEVMFNSALVYETAVLKVFAWRYLLEVPRSHPSYAKAYQLLKFLELFVPIVPDFIPANSILREFIGGSVFQY